MTHLPEQKITPPSDGGTGGIRRPGLRDKLGRRTASLLSLVLVLGAPVVISGCSAPADTASYGSNAPRKIENVPTYEVRLAVVDGLGPVLVDGSGITLYLFAPDHRGQPSTCLGVCAIQWPPLIQPQGTPSTIAGHGVDPALLGTVKRPDGSRQITYNGWPLYTWTADQRPGQATGQGLDNLGGLWWVVDAAGNAVTKQ